jgi:hypothetical protein
MKEWDNTEVIPPKSDSLIAEGRWLCPVQRIMDDTEIVPSFDAWDSMGKWGLSSSFR